MNEQELYDFREALDTQKEEEIIRLAQIYGNVNVSKGFPFAWSSSLNVDVSLPLLYCVLMRKPAAASILLGKCGAVPEAMDEKAHLNALELADKVDAAREGPAQAEMLPVLKVFGKKETNVIVINPDPPVKAPEPNHPDAKVSLEPAALPIAVVPPSQRENSHLFLLAGATGVALIVAVAGTLFWWKYVKAREGE